MSDIRKIVVTRDIGEQAFSILKRDPRLEIQTWSEPRPPDRAWLLKHVPGASGLLVMVPDKVDDELLDAAGPSLQVVSTMSVGLDHISLPALARRNIKLGYTPDVLTEAVADITVMLVLMVSRNVGQALQIVRNGEWMDHPWNPFSFCGPQLSVAGKLASQHESAQSSRHNSKIVGFLGFGRIAQATLRRLSSFGVQRIIYADSSSQRLHDAPIPDTPLIPDSTPLRVSVATLAANSDILIILAPQTPETYHIVSSQFLQLMKPTSMLVNVARGGLVDNNALADALKHGKIYGAGLDVVEGEPNIPKGHPLVTEPRCVILPHIGSATYETRVSMATLASRNLMAGLSNEPLEAGVNLEKDE